MLTENHSSEQLELLGYEVLQLHHPTSSGYSGVQFYLRPHANGHEPESITLRLRNGSEQVHNRKITTESRLPSPVQVYPGRVSLTSQRKAEAYFYTFGGELTAETLPEGVLYTLRSPAPIYELLQPAKNNADQLADEAEALFAQAEARHKISQKQLLENCLNAGPLTVYLAVVQLVLARYDHELAGQRPHHVSFLTMLRHEADWFQQGGLWPVQPSILAGLF